MEAVEIRRADVARDWELIRSIDSSFEVEAVLVVQDDARGFHLAETPVEHPHTKSFELDRASTHEWEHVWLALDREEPVGVIATQYSAWNRRVIIWHLYVSRSHRRRAIGRALLDAALPSAMDEGARVAWLETSNVNLSAVRAYERLGFRLCGLDTSLYEGTPAEGEVALYLCRWLAGD